MSQSDSVYCAIRGVYEGLEYGCRYPKLSEVGEHISVRLPDGRVRKYPSWTFSLSPPPRLGRWKLDDPICDPVCDCVDVSFELDGRVRWLTFVTPDYLARQLPRSGEPCWAQTNQVVVKQISEAVVGQCLLYLLEQGQLLAHSQPLDSENGLES